MLSWSERVNMLSINPDAATRHDVAWLTAEHQDMENTLRTIERLGGDGAVTASECIQRLLYHRQYIGR